MESNPVIDDDQYDKYLCPITGDLMEDPVICPDGYTYEKTAITTWLASHNTSPMTRQRMTTANMIQNRLVKEEIEELKKTLSVMPKRVVPLIKDKTVVNIASGKA